MDRKPKLEPDFPSSDHGEFNNMTIRELVSVLRGAYLMKDFDSVENVLVSRDECLNAENGKLREKAEMERLARIQAEEESRKKQELCEKGKILQESYERLLKNVKVNDGLDVNDVLRKKITELENEVNGLRKLKDDHKNTMDELMNKNFELVSQLYELRDLNEKWEKDSNALAELKNRVSVLEDANNAFRIQKSELLYDVSKLRGLNENLEKDSKALVELKSRVHVLEEDKNCLETEICELEEVVTKHLATIGELRDDKRKLVNEKHKIEIFAESLRVRFGELHGRVTRLEDDAKLLMTAGGNNEGKPLADPRVSTFQDNDEEDVGTDTMVEPFQKTKGRLELEKGIDIIDLEDDDDDDDLSQGLQGKMDLSKVSARNEHPSSSVAIQQKSVSANGQLDTIKRKIYFSGSSDSSTSSSSDDDRPLSSTLLHPDRKKPRQTVQD